MIPNLLWWVLSQTGRKVAPIQPSDIAKLHHGTRDRPYQANRTLGVLSKLFNLVVEVRRKYGHTVDCRDADVLERVLSSCSSTELVVQ